MITAIDLESPFLDFQKRIKHLRAIMVAIEVSAKTPLPSTPHRADVDLSIIGLTTSNTTNSMCIVFLASSFEEFFREEITQCGNYIASKYSSISEDIRIALRGSYWQICIERLRLSQNIITKNKPRSIDLKVVTEARSILESATGFPIGNDATTINGAYFPHHSRNFRPHVVEEIAARIGLSNLLQRVSDSNRLRAHFGVTKKAEVEPKLRAKLESFYITRNDIVHSLNSSTGYGVDYVFDYMEFLEIFAESVKNTLHRHVSSW
ncbi:HEPN domain-containing protein [Microvirga sp. Mcv34]|uniref:HEPN domain-containing protein n=1 Tax=Microvirga sp. Mcv34 TaxID=2926016 RepID=UPI0021C7DA9B|nr:HEPN domain-containing protein [Microvirga sp. Mcv34]